MLKFLTKWPVLTILVTAIIALKYGGKIKETINAKAPGIGKYLDDTSAA